MEKREQRARRDRRRDGKRNTFQNEQEKETIKQQESSVADKKNDAQSVEVSNKKNTSEDKDKSVEDDPLRFANLKRETDEIAALKAKKPHKRQVFSNWSKYEEPLPTQDESRAVDFETLLRAPQSGGFRFKSEQQWDTGSYGRFGELFTPDAELLVGGLTSLPFYERLGADKTSFSEDEIERMDSYAKENYVAYEKLSKSKPKPKVVATDFFKIEQAEYSVVDQANGQTVELSVSTVKPIFSVEEPPEIKPAELSLPAHAAGSSASDLHRESTAATGHAPEDASRDFHFGKPPPSSFGAVENPHSQTPGRETTPLRDGGRGRVSPEFSFERAPPPLPYASGNLMSPFHSRESTPAKEAAPATPCRDSDGPAAGREGTPDPEALPVRARETAQKVGDVRPRGGTPARDREDDGTSRETSRVRKVTYDCPGVASSTSREAEHSLDEIPPKVETSRRDEIRGEPILQRNNSDTRGEQTRRKSPYESDVVSEQKSDENVEICTENDSYSKKRGKSDIAILEAQQRGGGVEICTENDSYSKKRGTSDISISEGQQRGGGRHGRRKKGQNAPARGGDPGDTRRGTAEPGAEGADRSVAKAGVAERSGREGQCSDEAAREKPERPPPPTVPRLDQQQSPPPGPQLSSTPAAVQQTECDVPEPATSELDEPETGRVGTSATPPDSRAQPPQRKMAGGAKADPVPNRRSPAGRTDDDGLNFLMSLRGQKTGGVSEVEVAKSAAGAALSRSAIEEDEMKESKEPKPPPAITTEKKEDLEDWLDSMLDD